jgi:hypothetical protein
MNSKKTQVHLLVDIYDLLVDIYDLLVDIYDASVLCQSTPTMRQLFAR